ncbi:GNAT family N-acetyltransferase [Vibrio algivorus]|uniref:GNAT family N-acetyltransferase n=1 Tax=Vibrio algivorus TaxID=1667024 RepID=A0A557P9U3_9VIBR|nr:GNAT family N-acetyltransferase [Vibrio algivorus]TVO37421.1 GNAT family N-acetyltransferase [Vibrio algivorus]
MNVSYLPTDDVAFSAELTYQNMSPYYEKYGVEWQQQQIVEQVKSLDNWDIVAEGKVVGTFRLAFDADSCYLRDLQISSFYQNKGVGSAVLKEVERLALQSDSKKVKLKVFKVSPAFHLYQRSGFVVVKEDDRFFYMEKRLV